jgi:ABC-type multidrug transport system ATPase subunit
VIDVHDLKKRFGARKVVDGLSLQVRRGEICGFLGANGSGKTTTIRMLCGLLVPDGGSGTCLGYHIIREALLIRREVGYMTQTFGYYEDLTVRENLDLVARVYQMPDPRGAVVSIMDKIGIADCRDQLVGELSGGTKQRLALAACVLHQPKLLLLDEPTAGIDAKARRDFWDMIHDMASEGLTVLVSTHYMDEAERCTGVVYLANGRIVVQGAAQEVTSRSGIITFEAAGENLETVARQLRRTPGVEAAAVFGRALRIAGMDRAALEDAIRSGAGAALSWHEAEPRLEDVFIHMLSVTGERS